MKIRKLLEGRLRYFLYFFRFMRYRLVISLAMSFVIGLLDGLSLTMLIPLLRVAVGGEDAGGTDPNADAQVAVITDAMESLGLTLTLDSVLIVMFLLFLAKGMMKYVESSVNAYFQRYFIRKLRRDNVERLTNYRFKSFVLSDAGQILNTVTGEILKVNHAYLIYIRILQQAALITVYVTMAFVANPKFALTVGIGGYLINLLYKVIYSKTRKYSTMVTSESHLLQGMLMQMVSSYKYLRATGLAGKFSEKTKTVIDRIENYNLRSSLLGAVILATREPAIMMVVFASIFVQVSVLGESIELIFLSLLLFYRALTYITSLQNNYNNFLRNTGSLDNIEQFMTDLEHQQEVEGSQKLEQLKEGIELDHIDFSYASEKVIEDLSLKITKRESVAFVGESGSGKTTLMNLIAGLILPDTGKAQVDGIPMDQLDRTSYQGRIGYITQEPVIFDDSVFNNVTFWDESTEENVSRFWKALEQAAVADFVKGLEQAEETRLGANGIMISGGQKQRISIARELYKDIDILLLDEATSALDSETENVIKQNLDSLKGHYTIVVIAHRLSTVRNVDRIYFMENGSVIDQGDFDTLLERSERFRKMASLQEV